jgi:Na+/proline symporter
MNNLHAIDIAVIIGYLILCLVIGLYKAGKIKTIREYTLGSGNISTVVLLFTIFATHVGAGSTIGVVEKVHSMGLIFAVTLLAQPLFWLITTKIFAGNIDVFKKAGCMSVSDVMQLLYGKPGKWVTNIVSIFFSIGIIALQIGAIGYLFNYFLGISHFQGAMLGFGVLVTYSLFGGIRAVALTDTFQALVLLIAIPIACSIAFHEVGGYNELIQKLPSTHTSIVFTKENIILLAGMLFFTLMPLSEGTFMQRYLMANDSKQLTKALRMIIYISLPVASVVYLIGFIIKVKAPDVNPNIAFFYLISNYLPIGITGLLITGILAAIMSTADSWLNTTSVLCAHDIAKGLFPRLTNKQELLIARFSVLIISGLSATLALANPSLMGLLWMAGNFWFPIVMIPMAAGFLRFQTNQQSFIASTTCGALGIILGRYITGEFAIISLLLGAIGSIIGLLGMHYWQLLINEKPQNINFSVYLIESITQKPNLLTYALNKVKKKAAKYEIYHYPLGALGMIYFLGTSFFLWLLIMERYSIPSSI